MLKWITLGAKKSKLKIKTLSNAADKGYLSKKDEVAAEERFELENRAFFSKVSLPLIDCMFLPFQSDHVNKDIDMALRMPPKQVHKARRLPYFLVCWHSILHRS